jgi:hypothetical protein
MIDPTASHRLPADVPHFLERRAVVIEWLKEEAKAALFRIVEALDLRP